MKLPPVVLAMTRYAYMGGTGLLVNLSTAFVTRSYILSNLQPQNVMGLELEKETFAIISGAATGLLWNYLTFSKVVFVGSKRSVGNFTHFILYTQGSTWLVLVPVTDLLRKYLDSLSATTALLDRDWNYLLATIVMVGIASLVNFWVYRYYIFKSV